MPVFNGFSIPTLGMMSQAHSLNTIGNNIANVSTGGFRRTDTTFSTLLSSPFDRQSDIGGVTPRDMNRITQQGNMMTSSSDLDLAINGHGFFIFNTQRDGTGSTYYGRDGSFDMAPDSTISVTGNNGMTIQTKDGYLVDKNGYFLQGYTADPVTGLFTSNTLSSLRVDQYAFASTGQTTSTADLGLNLPAGDNIGYSQADSIQLAGAVEADDEYRVTVDGTTVSYKATVLDTSFNMIRNALVAAINADATVGALVTASNSPTTGALVITGKTIGQDLAVSSSVIDGGASSTAVKTATQPAVSGTTHSYNIEVIDSNLNARSARMDFTKTGANTWNMSQTLPRTAVAQVDTLTLTGTVEAGDTYKVSVGGASVNYTVTGLEGNLDGIRDAIVTKINADASISAVVTAAAGGAGKLTLTADTAGTSFTSSASATNRTPVAQVDTITIAAGSSELNDNYTTTVNGFNYTYITGGVENQDTIAAGLALAINADGALTATSVGAVITITADTAGTLFANAATVVTNVSGGAAPPGATDVATTANVTAVANTATSANTTANVSTTETTTTLVATITFDKDGDLYDKNGNLLSITYYNSGGTPFTSTDGTIPLSLSFPAQDSYAASTSTVTLDISDMTQYDGEFLPVSYAKNGFAKASVRSVSFDAKGQVLAQFDNSTARSVYRIPLAQFSNPNALLESNGNVYQATEASGSARIVDAGNDGYATFLPNTRELSNVDLAGEFSRMIMTQAAYNSSATVFRTVDEMLTYARDLKA